MSILVPQAVVNRILLLRGQRVMLDADLAELYGVETRALNQAVKRNADRFPSDFMFQLTAMEKSEVVTNCDHLAKLKSKLDQMERKLSSHDQAIAGLIDAIRQLMNPPAPARRGIGFTATIDSKPRNKR